MIEKAYKKLRLDALVIQQGRLTENTKTVNKDDLLSMVRYGAEMVFSSSVRARAGGAPSDLFVELLKCSLLVARVRAGGACVVIIRLRQRAVREAAQLVRAPSSAGA